MTTLTMRRRQGTWRLEGTDRDASLRTWHAMYHGEIQVDGRSWSVAATDRPRIGVVARAGDRPVVRLHPREIHVPGPGGPVRWALNWRHGRLTRDAASIDIHLSGWPRGRVQIKVAGAWAELELVALTAAFALLTHRHRRILLMMAVAGAIGHGPIG